MLVMQKVPHSGKLAGNWARTGAAMPRRATKMVTSDFIVLARKG